MNDKLPKDLGDDTLLLFRPRPDHDPISLQMLALAL